MDLPRCRGVRALDADDGAIAFAGVSASKKDGRAGGVEDSAAWEGSAEYARQNLHDRLNVNKHVWATRT